MVAVTFTLNNEFALASERKRLSKLTTSKPDRLINDAQRSQAEKSARAIGTFAAMVATATVVIAATVSLLDSNPALMSFQKPSNASQSASDRQSSYNVFDQYEQGNVDIHARNNVAENVLVGKISHIWKISTEMSRKIVELSFIEGLRSNVDPLLILSIIATESDFNTKARSSVGAEGVMQVWKKWHKDKYAKDHTADPLAKNVKIGVQVLNENIDRSNNNFRKALQRYNGTLHDTSMKYSNKVIGMHLLFKDIYRSSLVQRGDAFVLNDDYIKNKAFLKIKNG